MSRHLVRMWFSVPIEVFDAITDTAERVAGRPVACWAAEVLMARAKHEEEEIEGRRAAEELVRESEAKFGPIPEEVSQEADQFVESLLGSRQKEEQTLEALLTEMHTRSNGHTRRIWIAVRPEAADGIREVARRAGQSTSGWATEVLLAASRSEDRLPNDE